MTIADEIFALYDARAAGSYYGEPVSMLEHGLQAACFARDNAASVALVVASLLHDVGHLLDTVPDDIVDWKADARHEDVGCRWLATRFGPAVSEPVRLHVAAKRYLCATDSAYAALLSPASVHTLTLQGGPMTRAEVAAFERESFRLDAVHLRRWDDMGKVDGLKTPNLASYRAMIESLAASAHTD